MGFRGPAWELDEETVSSYGMLLVWDVEVFGLGLRA